MKATGIGFLALPRSAGAAAAHETSRWMGVPMVALAAACVGVGLAAGPVAAAIAGIAGGVVGRRDPAGTPVATTTVAPVGPGLGGAVYAAGAIGLLLLPSRSATWFVGHPAAARAARPDLDVRDRCRSRRSSTPRRATRS